MQKRPGGWQSSLFHILAGCLAVCLLNLIKVRKIFTVVVWAMLWRNNLESLKQYKHAQYWTNYLLILFIVQVQTFTQLLNYWPQVPLFDHLQRRMWSNFIVFCSFKHLTILYKTLFFWISPLVAALSSYGASVVFPCVNLGNLTLCLLYKGWGEIFQLFVKRKGERGEGHNYEWQKNPRN